MTDLRKLQTVIDKRNSISRSGLRNAFQSGGLTMVGGTKKYPDFLKAPAYKKRKAITPGRGSNGIGVGY